MMWYHTAGKTSASARHLTESTSISSLSYHPKPMRKHYYKPILKIRKLRTREFK